MRRSREPKLFRKLSRAVVVSSLLLTISVSHLEATAGQLTATWLEGDTSELGFSLERSTGTGGTFDEVGTTAAGVTSYTDLTVADGTTYCYRVRAFTASAYSNYSNVACATTVATTIDLAVVKTGSGGGTVISDVSGIICGSTCSSSYASGTIVTLTATPATGSSFSGWNGGGCSGTGLCSVTLSAGTTVTATFNSSNPPLVSLTVSRRGRGTGTVMSTPAGINCGSACSASYPSGATITLTASAPAGSVFMGWRGGGCRGTAPCTVSLVSAKTVRARFAARP